MPKCLCKVMDRKTGKFHTWFDEHDAETLIRRLTYHSKKFPELVVQIIELPQPATT